MKSPPVPGTIKLSKISTAYRDLLIYDCMGGTAGRGKTGPFPAWRIIHSIRKLTIFLCRSTDSSVFLGTFHHFSRHPRQHVAVACCALNTGWPRIGVCLPSFSGCAGARRCRTKSSACLRMVSIPFSAMYRLSASVRPKRLRNLDRASFANASSKVISALRFS